MTGFGEVGATEEEFFDESDFLGSVTEQASDVGGKGPFRGGRSEGGSGCFLRTEEVAVS